MSRKIYSFCKNKQFDNPAKNACRNSFWKVLTTISSLFLLVIFAQQTPANDSSKASESNDKIKIVSISAKLADNRPATALCIVFQQEIFCYYSDNNGKIKRDDDKRFNRSFLDFKPGTLSTWVKNKQLVEKFGGIEKTIEDSLSKTKTLLPTAETILQKIKEEDAPRVIAISKSVGKLEKTYEDFDDYIHENFLTEISNSPDQSKADTPQSTSFPDPPTDNKTSNTSPPQTAQTEQTDYKIYFYSLYILLAVVIVLLVLTVFISGKKKETQKITDIKETLEKLVDKVQLLINEHDTRNKLKELLNINIKEDIGINKLLDKLEKYFTDVSEKLGLETKDIPALCGKIDNCIKDSELLINHIEDIRNLLPSNKLPEMGSYLEYIKGKNKFEAKIGALKQDLKLRIEELDNEKKKLKEKENELEKVKSEKDKLANDLRCIEECLKEYNPKLEDVKEAVQTIVNTQREIKEKLESKNSSFSDDYRSKSLSDKVEHLLSLLEEIKDTYIYFNQQGSSKDLPIDTLVEEFLKSYTRIREKGFALIKEFASYSCIDMPRLAEEDLEKWVSRLKDDEDNKYIRLELVSILRDWDNVIRNLKEKRHQDIIEALELEELEGVFKTELNKITSELKKLSTNYAITEEINTNLSWLNTLFRAELLLQSYFLEMSAFNPLRDLIGKLSILMRKVLRMNGYELMSIYLLDEQKPEADKLVYQTEDSDISKKLLSLINVQNRVKLHQNIRKIANFFVDVEGFRYLNINAGNNAENVKGICRVCLKTEAERR